MCAGHTISVVKRTNYSALVLATAMLALQVDLAGQTRVDSQRPPVEPVRYTLSFPAPHTHYIEVSAVFPTGRRPHVELMMAVWTPGSYLVREYERNVEAVRAEGHDGAALPVEKSRKNRWKVSTNGAPAITVNYRVYGREMGVRSNWVESAFAMLNGAPTFITLADRTPRPHEVTITMPAAWKQSITGLSELAGGGPNQYRAQDFDTLVDSPIIVGNPDVQQFTVGGKKHYLVSTPATSTFDSIRAAADVQKIVEQNLKLWGDLPYDKYLFLNMLTESGGGLEHKNSTLIMTNRWTTHTRKSYLSWLGLCSHEYFHAWNVKRLRPVELGPFDYENEVYTRSLWVSEGFTDYYGELNVHRAGLSTREEYLEAISNMIEELQTTPGRLVQSAATASYDAWVKLYRPDENSVNASISYYTKGALIAFLLDGKVRKITNGSKGLDDVMRAAFEKYSGDRGFTPDEFRAVAEQVAGVSLKSFWDAAILGTGELDYTEVLETFGLRFKPAEPAKVDPPAKAYLGINTRSDARRLIVTQVRRDTPAYDAGVNVEDEIIAIDNFRVRADRLDDRLDQYKPGATVSLLVARREELVRLDVTLGTEPPKRWQIEVDPSATDASKKQLTNWLT
jgi:predicted metalloprotease with PDZ domain